MSATYLIGDHPEPAELVDTGDDLMLRLPPSAASNGKDEYVLLWGVVVAVDQITRENAPVLVPDDPDWRRAADQGITEGASRRDHTTHPLVCILCRTRDGRRLPGVCGVRSYQRLLASLLHRLDDAGRAAYAPSFHSPEASIKRAPPPAFVAVSENTPTPEEKKAADDSGFAIGCVVIAIIIFLIMLPMLGTLNW